MRLRINPLVDIVFKVLFGSEENKDLLCAFLNDYLKLQGDNRLVEVTLINPFNIQRYEEDKLSVVDIKVKDASGRTYQIDVQVVRRPSLPKRMLHNWSRIYGESLQKKEDFDTLKPVISIWILASDLPALPTNLPGLRGDGNATVEKTKSQLAYLSFGVYSKEAECYLTEDFELHVLQLKNAVLDGIIRDGRDRWAYFFKNGSTLDPNNLPPGMDTPEILEAMSVAEAFYTEEQKRHIYESRLTVLRIERELERERAETLQEAETAKALYKQERLAREQERREKEAALIREEKERHEKEQERREKEAALIRVDKERHEKEQERREKESERHEKEAALIQVEQERREKEQERREKEALMQQIEALKKQFGQD